MRPRIFTLANVNVKVKSPSRVRLCDPVDCGPPGSSVHGILQARILEWGAISFSRGSSRPRDQTQVSRIALTSEPPPGDQGTGLAWRCKIRCQQRRYGFWRFWREWWRQEYNQSDFGIHNLGMSMCRVFSCVVGRGCLLWPVHFLGKTLLVFVLLHSVFQGQICLLLT